HCSFRMPSGLITSHRAYSPSALCPSSSLNAYSPPPHLHSLPTRRSSDLSRPRATRRSRRSTTCCATKRACPRRPNRPSWLSPTSDRKSTRLNSSHVKISYAVFCLKKKTKRKPPARAKKTPRDTRGKQQGG